MQLRQFEVVLHVAGFSLVQAEKIISPGVTRKFRTVHHRRGSERPLTMSNAF